MRYLISCGIALLTVVCCLSQNKQLLYGLENIPQSLLLNPGGEVNTDKHFGIPFLSGNHFNAGSSGVTVFDIFGDDGGDINAKIREKISELTEDDFFTATQQLELVNIGWRNLEGTYFSAGWYQELDFIAYFPKDLAVLATEGNNDFIGEPFDLGQVNARGDVTSVFHIGINKQVNKKLTVGARAKLYSSVLSISSTSNSGTFTTVPSENGLNVFEHRLQNIDLAFQGSGLASLNELDGSALTSTVIGRTIFSGNYGLGLDLGFTYQLTNKLQLSASAIDIGAIFHATDTETFRAKGDFTLNGIELVFPPLEDGESTFPYYDNLEDEFNQAVTVDTTSTSFVQTRPLKIYGQLAYNFGNFVGGEECDCLKKGQISRVNEAGVHLFAVARPRGPQAAGTLFYRRRFSANFTLKGTYTVDAYSADNIGAAVALDIGEFNFYIAADNLLDSGNIAKANSVSLQLGVNLKWDQE